MTVLIVLLAVIPAVLLAITFFDVLVNWLSRQIRS
jgi:hypothetical protein